MDIELRIKQLEARVKRQQKLISELTSQLSKVSQQKDYTPEINKVKDECSQAITEAKSALKEAIDRASKSSQTAHADIAQANKSMTQMEARISKLATAEDVKAASDGIAAYAALSSKKIQQLKDELSEALIEMRKRGGGTSISQEIKIPEGVTEGDVVEMIGKTITKEFVNSLYKNKRAS